MAMRFSLSQTPGSLMQVMAWCPSAFAGHANVKPGAEYADRYARAAVQPSAVAAPLAGKAEDAGGGVGAGGGGGGGGGTVVVVVGGDVVMVVGGDVVVVVVGGDVAVVVDASDCVVDVRDVVVTADAPTPVPIPPNTSKKSASMRTALPNNTVRSLTSRPRPCTASCPTAPSFWPR